MHCENVGDEADNKQHHKVVNSVKYPSARLRSLRLQCGEVKHAEKWITYNQDLSHEECDQVFE